MLGQHDTAQEQHRNPRAMLYLAGSGVALLAGWGFVALLLDPSIRAPSPWTQILTGLFLGILWVYITLKVPLAVAIDVDHVRFRFLFASKLVPLAGFSYVEYRIQSTYLSRPIEEREYAITIRTGTRRLVDGVVDGRIASLLMPLLKAPHVVLRVYRGRQQVEETPLPSSRL